MRSQRIGRGFESRYLHCKNPSAVDFKIDSRWIFYFQDNCNCFFCFAQLTCVVFGVYIFSRFMILKLLYTAAFDAKISKNIIKILQSPSPDMLYRTYHRSRGDKFRNGPEITYR